MQLERKTIYWIAGAAIGGAAILYYMTTAAPAADLGGNCCADLEERIAELEATTARKGNRKVSLTISGQINAGILWTEIPGYTETEIIQNGTDQSVLSFQGEARISPATSAGYNLTFDLRQLGLLNAPVSSFEPTVQQSYWWIKNDSLGKMAIGKQAVATQDFDKITTANTTAVAKPFSLGALSDTYLTGIDVPFDGTYRNVVRYDSPVLSGFMASASWGQSSDINSSDGNGNAWDVALRYVGDFNDVKIAGGVGYRKDTDLEINVLNIINIVVPTGDVKTILAVGSMRHVTTGLFLTANWADQDWQDANFKLKGWNFQGGIERKWSTLGPTTIYGEYGNIEFAPDAGSSADVDIYGLGLVQNIENAGMDLYIGYRKYDAGGFDVETATAGARVKF